MAQTTKKVKVPTSELAIGMFVCGLDRPWLETPFLLQGFSVQNQHDIDTLQSLCKYVYVDVLQSLNPERLASIPDAQPSSRRREPLFPHKKRKIYQDTVSMAEEILTAQSITTDLNNSVKSIWNDLKNTRSIDIPKLQKSVDPMLDSVLRNPDACLWLARMKGKGDYIYKHSVSASIWAAALGRQLGLPRQDLADLAIGSLLFDVGKLQLPSELLEKKERLTPEEFNVIKTHVELGLELLEKTEGITQQVRDMVGSHHERYDGSGYPFGLIGNDIPIFARIAALVDCYDAITSERPYCTPLSPSTAIKKLYEWRDIDFQAELIEEFIQAIGIYPAGTLVELSNEEIGIVLSEYRTRRLRPKVLIIMDAEKNLLDEMRPLDLTTITHDERGLPLEIVTSLEVGAYGIDPESLYLF